MTDIREIHEEIETTLGRDINGVGMVGDKLVSIELVDGDSLSESERQSIISNYGDAAFEE
jgi:hypothetical protein